MKDIMLQKAIEFSKHLSKVIPEDALELLDKFSIKGDVYIFSGIIRDFFLGINEIRDLDFVYWNTHPLLHITPNIKMGSNSYGGYKLKISELCIDCWSLSKTERFKLNYDPDIPTLKPNAKNLPGTAFFGCNAIIFNYKTKEFIWHDLFEDFYKKNTIKLVNKYNSNYNLCLLNAVIYSKIYNLKLDRRLIKFLLDRTEYDHKEFEKCQIKHYGEVYFPIEFALYFLKEILPNKRYIERKKVRRSSGLEVQ